eukprot:GFKZ01015608.1.p1 GENE.GFKZ01015608.1~~GFKZ01015608.1.p1  ORF type:complete len:324 (+),score=14.53 GFKZ01015608.1:186-1157(+)
MRLPQQPHHPWATIPFPCGQFHRVIAALVPYQYKPSWRFDFESHHSAQTPIASSPPPAMLPPPPTYTCPFTPSPPPINGLTTSPVWSKAPWSSPFVDIAHPTTHPPPDKISTRFKLLHDAHHLYLCAYMTDPHIWATITTPNTPIFHDPDFELFLAPSPTTTTSYYELEINPLATTWQLKLDKPYHLGGHPTSPFALPGLRHAVHIHGAINNPNKPSHAWSLTLAIPFHDLLPLGWHGSTPQHHDVWRVNMSRVWWPHRVVDGCYQRVPPHGTELKQGPDQSHPERNLVWSPTGIIDIHRPNRWGFVKFERSSEPTSSAPLQG